MSIGKHKVLAAFRAIPFDHSCSIFAIEKRMFSSEEEIQFFNYVLMAFFSSLYNYCEFSLGLTQAKDQLEESR